MTSEVEEARSGPPKAVVVAVVGVVVLAVLLLLFVAGGDEGDDSEQVSSEVRPVDVTGEWLPTFDGPVDPAAGTVAPTVAGEGFDGRPVRIEDDGTPKLIVFLAHWCPHCRNEVPVLAAWLEENGHPPDVDLYAVASRTDPQLPNHPPSAWLAREGFDVPTIADDADATALQSFGVSAFPFFVALDEQHRVVARTSGELTVEQWEVLLHHAATGSSD